MTEFSFPFENVDVSEDQFSDWASMFQLNGVRYVSKQTGASSFNLTYNAGSLTVTVGHGEAFINGFFYKLTEPKVFSLVSPGIGRRRDTLVLELDKAANAIQMKVVQGVAVAASSPANAPALTQTANVYQIALHILSLEPASSSSLISAVTDVRRFNGFPSATWNYTPDDLALGQHGHNTSFDGHEFRSFDGVRSVGSYKVQANAPSALQNAHTQGLLVFENGTATEFQIQKTLRIGERVDWVNYGAGQVTFVALGGAILRAPSGTKSRIQYSAGSIVRVKENEFLLVGDLTA